MHADTRDIEGREPDGVPDSGGGREIIAASAAVFLRVQRGVCLARFGFRTGRVRPRLPRANERGLTRATFRRPAFGAMLPPSPVGLRRTRERTDAQPFAILQALGHAEVFALSIVRPVEFCDARGFFSAIKFLNVTRDCDWALSAMCMGW
jgi:hypothetical protein